MRGNKTYTKYSDNYIKKYKFDLLGIYYILIEDRKGRVTKKYFS